MQNRQSNAEVLQKYLAGNVPQQKQQSLIFDSNE